VPCRIGWYRDLDDRRCRHGADMIARFAKRIGAFTVGFWAGCAYGALIVVFADQVRGMLP
jgi:hypothetical protein